MACSPPLQTGFVWKIFNVIFEVSACLKPGVAQNFDDIRLIFDNIHTRTDSHQRTNSGGRGEKSSSTVNLQRTKSGESQKNIRSPC